MASGTIETVTDDMRRWDDEGAAALVVRGGGSRGIRLTGLSAFDFRPGGFTGTAVRIERLVAGATSAPTAYPNLTDFRQPLPAAFDGELTVTPMPLNVEIFAEEIPPTDRLR